MTMYFEPKSFWSTLYFSGSRLWKLVHANTKEEILRVCDRFKPGIDSEQDFVPAEYFFDHNYTSFAEILDAYRSGHLHLQVSKNQQG